ncbi:energy transducer TonB [Pseudomonas indica]|uniref:energy transducer TonB n=1 Tax=Pseudomonas indica TaxID=137658 RepID=UPI0023F88106|nr:energy transducer TonB [Pseudomonas indica]MBU3059465.1 energy transducer TonB [Pseudomonas indica]
MITELRRRAYLGAMQVVSWLPRSELPFAAPSRPELFEPPAPEPEVAAAPVVETPAPSAAPSTVPTPAERPRIEVPRPATQARGEAKPVAADEPAPAEDTRPTTAPPPRFALQLLRAGDCLLLVELPNGESFQSRDPAYLLLKDLLRAAGLPDSPRLIGEPVRWPLLVRGNMDQGPDAARDFLQGFVAARMDEGEPCACLWLVGLPAVRFAGEADSEAFNRELRIEGLGAAWALPGLEMLMEEPARKAELWQAMRRVRQRWMSRSE